MNQKRSFAAMVALVGMSVTFGYLLGGGPASPPTLFASESAPTGVMTGLDAAYPDFAEIAARATTAVVGVTNTSVRSASDRDADSFFNDPFFRRFFGRPDEPEDSPSEERRVANGSGFIISKDGYILTNHHVVENSSRLVVELDDGERFDAEVVGTDPPIDLALIKIDPEGRELPVLPLGDSERLRVGEWVLAIGNPIDLDHTVTVGVVSGKGRQVPIGSTDAGLVKFIQTDAAINFGNSGGPLLDSHGKVVGINTAIIRGHFTGSMVEGIGFALPINEAKKVVEQLREHGSVQRGFLGITMHPTGIDDVAQEYYKLPDRKGVIIESVRENGPSESAGLLEGDIIRKVDDASVDDNEDLLARVASRRPGDKVNLELWRDGKPIRKTVTLGTRPTDFSGQGSPPPPDEEDRREEAQGLGIKVEDISSRIREGFRERGVEIEGVVVTDVEIDSDAADAGIEAGMFITSVNGHSINSVADWNAEFDRLEVGDPVRLTIRAGQLDRAVFLRVPEKR